MTRILLCSWLTVLLLAAIVLPYSDRTTAYWLLGSVMALAAVTTVGVLAKGD